ncbi:MAG: hypothetical protein QXO95_00600 [Candidatus Aenigmatarchaeota archaeon]
MKVLATILLFFVSLFLLVYFLKPEENLTEKFENKLEIFTDKEAYTQGEEIKVNVSFFSSKDLEDVEIKVFGIKGRYGDYISSNKVVNLRKGENLFDFYFRAPYCSACTGIAPGEHEINVQLVYNNTLLASVSKKIRIES